jgi:exosortase A-associated hydrolase 1
VTVQTEEIPVVFNCQGDHLVGMVHRPVNAETVGVLLIVGGPQYRVGSHRQFVLLARMLAANGVPVMRFDYRGMGDSTGLQRSFADVDDDIREAMNIFFQHCPEITGVALWGLCDAASAALFYGYQDARVQRLVLLNPWVFTEQGAAKTYLKHYYWQRLFSPQLWRKVFTLQFDYRASFASLLAMVTRILSANESQTDAQNVPSQPLVDHQLPLPDRMRECLQRFDGSVLFILSGRDLTADEFREVVKADAGWQALFQQSRVTRQELPEADHTFSSAKWRNDVADITLQWLKNKQT